MSFLDIHRQAATEPNVTSRIFTVLCIRSVAGKYGLGLFTCGSIPEEPDFCPGWTRGYFPTRGVAPFPRRPSLLAGYGPAVYAVNQVWARERVQMGLIRRGFCYAHACASLRGHLSQYVSRLICGTGQSACHSVKAIRSFRTRSAFCAHTRKNKSSNNLLAAISEVAGLAKPTRPYGWGQSDAHTWRISHRLSCAQPLSGMTDA